MIRIPRNIVAPMLVSFFLVGFIGIQTNIFVAIGLFIVLVGIPMAYMATIYYLGTAMTIRGDIKGAIEHYSRVLKANEQFKIPVNRVFLHTQRAALLNAVGDLDGAYSRRINIQHRVVYQVLEDVKAVKVLRLWTHYE